MTTLSIHHYNQLIQVNSEGHVMTGEVVKEVLSYTVERYDTYLFTKSNKQYDNFKEAFKSLIKKAKEYPGVHYRLILHFIHQSSLKSTTEVLLDAYYRKHANTIHLSHGYEKHSFGIIHLEEGKIEHEYEDNEESGLLERWLPQKRERKETWIQKEIRDLKTFNFEHVDFKGIVDDEKKKRFFQEAKHCSKRIKEWFPLQDFFPIKRIYFSNFKTNYGIYRFNESSIAFNPECITNIRDVFYHEYGHHLYECGLCAPFDWLGQTISTREESVELLNLIMETLHKTNTIKEITKRATQRMERDNKKRDNADNWEYHTEEEKYLLKHTEMFARLFEAYMLLNDQEVGESMEYQLDYSVEELKMVEPLLLRYLDIVHKDYVQDKEYKQSKMSI